MSVKTQEYLMGYSDTFIKLLMSRRLETHGQFIKQYLKPGLKILDCGCGPGSMTLDFAVAVSPGEVIGVDIAEDQLAIARKNAEAAGVANVAFHYGNTLELHFPDNTFDLVFSQALLSHLKDPLLAVKEQKRVLKPGGILATRNGYFANHLCFPANEILLEALEFYVRPVVDAGGDNQLGLKLGKLFNDAGLHHVTHELVCEQRNIQTTMDLMFRVLTERDYTLQALQQGLITRERLHDYQQAFLEFCSIPGAYYGFLWGEAVGSK